jgi:hypothetical protein
MSVTHVSGTFCYLCPGSLIIARTEQDQVGTRSQRLILLRYFRSNFRLTTIRSERRREQTLERLRDAPRGQSHDDRARTRQQAITTRLFSETEEGVPTEVGWRRFGSEFRPIWLHTC